MPGYATEVAPSIRPGYHRDQAPLRYPQSFVNPSKFKRKVKISQALLQSRPFLAKLGRGEIPKSDCAVGGRRSTSVSGAAGWAVHTAWPLASRWPSSGVGRGPRGGCGRRAGGIWGFRSVGKQTWFHRLQDSLFIISKISFVFFPKLKKNRLN